MSGIYPTLLAADGKNEIINKQQTKIKDYDKRRIAAEAA